MAALCCALATRAETPLWSLSSATQLGEDLYEVGKVDSGAGSEVSGVVMSRSRTNWFWSHRDGDRDKVTAFNAKGNVLSTTEVTGFTPVDVEDIAADSAGNLYLANTGDNDETRTEVEVVRFPEPAAGQKKVAVTRTWRLRWPGSARDAESLVIHGGYGWLLARIRFDGEGTSLMRFRLDSTAPVQTLEDLGELPVYNPVAGADLTPDGSRLALTSKRGAYVWQVDGDLTRAVRETPAFTYNPTDTQKEGATFVPQGLLVVAETRELYLYTAEPFRPPALVPRLNRVETGPRGLDLGWQATLGVACTVEATADPAVPAWSATGEAVPGLGENTSLLVLVPDTAGTFYRVMVDAP
jgi:hypothetical protein